MPRHIGSLFEVPLVLLALTIFKTATADERLRPKSLQEIQRKVALETFVKVANAEVAYLNEIALKRDFPHLANYSRVELEKWVLDNFAFVSEAQLQMNEVRNSVIPVDAIKREALRPLGYGRASIFEAIATDSNKNKVMGLVDLKGTGLSSSAAKRELDALKKLGAQNTIDDFRTKDHSDGLMSLGEGIAELSRQQALQRLFDLERKENPASRAQTVENYFLIKLPFGILKKGSEQIPAAIVGRQAHFGREGDYSGNSKFHRGTQHTSMGGHIDFGNVALTDARLKDTFGDKFVSAQRSNAWRYGHEVAKAFVQGDRLAIERHLNEMLAPLNPAPKDAPLPNPAQGLDGLRAHLGPNSPHFPRAEFTLAQLGYRDEEVKKGLVQALDGNAEAQILGLKGLKLYFAALDPVVARKVVKLFGHHNSSVSSMANLTIERFKIGGPEIEQEILSAIDSTELNKKWRAVKLIGTLELTGDHYIEKLLKTLDQKDFFLRSEVVDTLSKLKVWNPAIHTRLQKLSLEEPRLTSRIDAFLKKVSCDAHVSRLNN